MIIFLKEALVQITNAYGVALQTGDPQVSGAIKELGKNTQLEIAYLESRRQGSP